MSSPKCEIDELRYALERVRASCRIDNVAKQKAALRFAAQSLKRAIDYVGEREKHLSKVVEKNTRLMMRLECSDIDQQSPAAL